jgi:GPH family glycoside/pentoside/hexuronide:cation symporter
LEKLKFREKLGYGLGDTASNFFFVTFNMFLLYYYTDVFGLLPAAVGTMFLVTKVVDAVSDPIMGLIADRTNSRWGKYRPYLLWAAVPYGFCGYLMFANPDLTYLMFANPDLTPTAKLVYAYVTYSLMMLAYTAINVPYSALMGVISPSSLERTKVASYRFFGAFLAGWLIATFVTPLKNILGGGDDALGFQLTMTIFAVTSVLLFWITFATTRERVKPPQEDTNIRRDLAAVSKNGPWIALIFAGVFALTNIAVRQGAQIYYLKYFVGDDGTPLFLIFDKTAVFLSLGTLAMLVGVTLTKALSLRFDKRALMIVLSLLNALSLAYADCADYGEWKSGRRTTALIFSTVQFSHKFGLAVGAGLAGIMLSWFGFVANEVQSESALFGIRFMFSVVPAAFAILSVIAIFFYRIDSTLLRQIEHDLAERHSTA